MNVSLLLLKFLRISAAVFLLPALCWGQNFDPIDRITTVQNQAVDYIYSSLGGPGQTHIHAQTNHHGNFIGPIPLGQNNYRIIFSPTSGTGKDTVTIYFKKPPQGLPYYRKVEVTVHPSYLNARRDFVTTGVGQAISIPVTANDSSNRGVKILTDIAMVNNGIATISGSNVTFVPDAQFEGITNFDYIVCDDLGTCDATTVHVCVGDPYGGTSNDTLRIFTNKNMQVPVLTPLADYTLTTPPSNGYLQTDNGILNYIPDNHYTGSDYFVFTHNSSGNKKTIESNVLDIAAPNKFVFDDLEYTVINKPVEINLTENDLYGAAMYNVQIIDNPAAGTVQMLNNGICIYTPNTNFEGVDAFTYSASPNSNGSNPEIGTVNVIVSNQNPAATVFELRTPKNTMLVINYNIPVKDYDFNISSQGSLGTVTYLPGDVDTVINGNVIEGYNLLLYEPTSGITGQDEFEVEYCVNGNNTCPVAKVIVDIQDVTPPAGGSFCVGADCVWAGDANLDGEVNLKDLLPVGWCIGDVGTPRANASINPWYGQGASDWGARLPGTNTDMKHVDMDGDSLVTSYDTAAINQHYKKNHSLSPAPVNFPTNIPLFLGEADTIYVAGPGDIIEIPIYLGDTNIPAEDIYGLTFTIDYDDNVMNANESTVVFNSSSWMSYNSPVLSMTKKPFSGRIDAAYTRTNGLVSSGYGKIGYVSFIVIDDLDPGRFEYLEVATISGSVMTGSGTYQDISPATVKLQIGQSSKKQGTTATHARLNRDDVRIYPNPVNQQLNINVRGGNELTGVKVFDFTGRNILQKSFSGVTDTVVSVADMKNGLYIIQLETTEGIVIQKFEVVK